ncbi:MAG: DUF222 domain-containing protein [Gammaproteobacteria bacterium]|nr:DUF222 domain-containing protein [Gammaproteobacteria bacterium]
MHALVTPFRPLDDLTEDLLGCWAEVSQATYRFLILLREFDLRQCWTEWGCADCADWLNLKCGITRSTAQEKLRTAYALVDLPQIEEAFKRGDLSYSKVRALTRVATPANEIELLDFALSATAAQVENHCRQLRNGDRAVSTTEARRVHDTRSLSRYFRDDGTATLTVELPREDANLVLQALEFVGAALPDIEGRSMFAVAADALVQMSRDALGGRTGGGGSAGDQYQVIVHVDESALKDEGGKSDLPVESVRRLCCDGSLIPIVEDRDGEPLNVGRKHRTIPTGIKRALLARDRSCSFPGCTHDKWVDAHHIKHWIDGGETRLENLTLLCTHHHRLVHEGGFQLKAHREGGYYFVRPNGRPVDEPFRPHCRANVNGTSARGAI